jgi:L-lactate dehydrogenase complex protein LldE
MRVGLFVSCLVDLMRPSIGFATLRLLEHAGCTVSVPARQTCCGQPGYNAGDESATRELAIKLAIEFADCDYVVVPSGSCAGMIRVHYPQLFTDDAEPARRVRALAARTYELTDFLATVARIQDVPGSFSGRITYHDSCSGLRELGVKQQPRALLAMLPDLHLVEMKQSETCCGFGGTFSVKFGELSANLAERKCRNVHTSTANAVVGGDWGCLMNIEGRLHRMGDHATRVLHVAEVLAGEQGVVPCK